MWNHVKDWAQIAAAADITPTVVVALFGVLVAWRQLTLNRTNQRETTAKTTYREFLKLAVQYPDLSGGGTMSPCAKKATTWSGTNGSLVISCAQPRRCLNWRLRLPGSGTWI